MTDNDQEKPSDLDGEMPTDDSGKSTLGRDAATSQSEPLRERLDVRGELALVLLPTLTILLVLGLIEALSHQRLLFASLASSAFLIYLDPGHKTNTARTLLIAHTLAALTGTLAHLIFGDGYLSAGVAMIVLVVAMVLLNAVHPPAVSTALAFAFRQAPETNLLLFELSLLVVILLVALQRGATWLLARLQK